jgi:hypothetical protein
MTANALRANRQRHETPHDETPFFSVADILNALLPSA